MKRFYGNFAAAYGTIWLGMMVLALVTQSHIETGLLGLIGFPVISLIYAVFRVEIPRSRYDSDEGGPSHWENQT